MVSDFFEELVSNLRKSDFFGICAKSAYYLLLAVFPFLIFLINFINMLPLGQDAVSIYLMRLFPDAIAQIIDDNMGIISAKPSGGLMSVGVLVGVYVASRAIASILKGLDFSKGDNVRGFFKNAFISVFLTIGFVVVISGYFALSILSNRFLSVVAKNAFVEALWLVAEMIFYFFTIFLSAFLLYYFASDRQAGFMQIFPGAIFCALFLIISSKVFSFYATQLKDYSLVYGTLSGAAATLAWLYLIAMGMVLGGEVCIAFFRIGKK